MFSDTLNVAWLIDTCSEYVDKCVLESNDVSILVTQACELHNQHKMNSNVETQIATKITSIILAE